MFEILFIELRRKALHVTGSLIPVVYFFLSKQTAIISLSVINAILLSVEWLRLSGKIRLPEILLRQHENNQVAGYIYFQMGALLAILLFNKTIAIAAILMLALGDAASGLAGAIILSGNIRIYDAKKVLFKPLPVMAVMFAVCVFVGLVLLSLPLPPDMIHLPLLVYIAGALGATLGDAIPVRVQGRTIDDNLIIPILSGLFMTAAKLTIFH